MHDAKSSHNLLWFVLQYNFTNSHTAPNPSHISKIYVQTSKWITFPLKIPMKNDQIQIDEYGKVSNLS